MTTEAATYRQLVVRKATLEKKSGRAIYEHDREKQINAILASVSTKQVAMRGWKIEPERQVVMRRRWAGDPNPRETTVLYEDIEGRGSDHTYRIVLKGVCTLSAPRPDAALEAEWAAIVANMAHAGKKPSWAVAAVDGEPYTAAARLNTPDGLPQLSSADQEALVGYAPFHIPADFETFFTDENKGGGLYGLDHHISIVKGALEAAERSGWRNRYHVMLAGPPGCGKTHLVQCLKRALRDNSVLEYDGTATTKAGAEKDLLERPELPRVLVIEEIEKVANPEALDYLLALLDQRAEIRKTTFKGSVQRDVRMWAVCTVNDVELFKTLRSGALYSRFTNKVYFKRPTHDMLASILEREVKASAGDPRWIEPAIAFADQLGASDPRQVQAICLCGADRLLDGTYQEAVSKTSPEAAGYKA